MAPKDNELIENLVLNVVDSYFIKNYEYFTFHNSEICIRKMAEQNNRPRMVRDAVSKVFQKIAIKQKSKFRFKI